MDDSEYVIRCLENKQRGMGDRDYQRWMEMDGGKKGVVAEAKSEPCCPTARLRNGKVR
jgi:hypothetical protein